MELHDVLKADDPAFYRAAMAIAAEAVVGGLGGWLYGKAQAGDHHLVVAAPAMAGHR